MGHKVVKIKTMKNRTTIEDGARQWHSHVEGEVQTAFERVAWMLLDRPSECRLETETVGDTVGAIAFPDPQDVAVLVGAGGATQRALRVLLAAVARKGGLDCAFSVRDEHLRVHVGRKEWRDDPAWPKDEVGLLVRRTCEAMFSLPFVVSWLPDGQGREVSHLEVTLSPSEPKRTTDAELTEALSRVVNAVGARNGRKIYVERVERRPL